MEVKGQQSLNTVNHALWLPNLVRRNAGAIILSASFFSIHAVTDLYIFVLGLLISKQGEFC